VADQFPDATKMVLSPAAQAVLDAAGASEPGIYATIAAALRAAAEQPYEVPAYFRGDDYWRFRDGVDAERNRLLALAAELDPTP
jgi:hypothetical protein